jgi:N-acetylglucosamine kinase-like BadF-type ATPase
MGGRRPACFWQSFMVRTRYHRRSRGTATLGLHCWQSNSAAMPGIDYSFPMRFVLGLDGGGTKTDCVLMDETGAVLVRTRSGPSNPSRVGLEAALAALIDAAEKALAASAKSAIEIAAVHGGIAGAARVIPDLARVLKRNFPSATVLISTDLSIALAATRELPSVVIIAGTGSAVMGRDSSGNLAREGGWGPTLGDPGSAYDIGRRAVIFGLRQSSSSENTRLPDEILHAFDCNWVELQEHIRRNADSILPRVFPIVARAANHGDDFARALLHTAAGELAELVTRVVESLKLQRLPVFLAKTGGVFGRSPFLDDPFDALVRKIAPKARIGPLPEPIAEFAARTAVECLDSPVKNVVD